MDDVLYNTTEEILRAYHHYKEAHSLLTALAHVQAYMAEDIANGEYEHALEEAALCLVDILEQYHEFRLDEALAAKKPESKPARKKGKAANNVIKLKLKRKPKA